MWRSVLTAVALSLLLGACARNANSPRYRAERDLYQARKLQGELAKETLLARSHFVQQVLDSYRHIVDQYSQYRESSPEVAKIVASAQISLAELEYKVGMYKDAITDYQHAVDLSDGMRELHARATFNAAYLLQQVGDTNAAIAMYEQFYNDYLDDTWRWTTKHEARYLSAPLSLAELESGRGDAAAERKWLERSEALYKDVIADFHDTQTLRRVYFDLLTAHLQLRRWQDALADVRLLRDKYSSQENLSSLAFLEARIYRDGLGEKQEALNRFEQLARDYSGTQDAAKALLAAAGMRMASGDVDGAEALYRSVTRDYQGAPVSASEAEWDLAEIEKKRGDWDQAVLRYKAIMGRYPDTPRGLEAPLALAVGHRDRGYADVAANAFDQARTQYEKIIQSQTTSPLVRVRAEEQLVKLTIERKQWKKAVDLLVSLPDRYPWYPRFHTAFLDASAICEKELGDTTSALEYLRAAADRYPDTKVATMAHDAMRRLQSGR